MISTLDSLLPCICGMSAVQPRLTSLDAVDRATLNAAVLEPLALLTSLVSLRLHRINDLCHMRQLNTLSSLAALSELEIQKIGCSSMFEAGGATDGNTEGSCFPAGWLELTRLVSLRCIGIEGFAIGALPDGISRLHK
jgi:hypothetical protein